MQEMGSQRLLLMSAKTSPALSTARPPMTKDIVFTCDCMAFKATSDCAAVSAAAVSLTLGAAAWGEPLPAGSGFGSASSDFALSTRRPAGGFRV